MEPVREHYRSIASTQPRARELALAGAAYGTRVVAESQTHGRGRADHRWASPPGGLYLSVLVHPPGHAEPLLPLAIGATLASELDRRWGVPVRLKWPNDLWVEGPDRRVRKLGGVLIDAVEDRAGRRTAIVGIGVNVGRPAGGFPSDLVVPAIALEDLIATRPPVREVEDLAVGAALAASRDLEDPAAAERTVTRCRDLLYGVGRSARAEGGIRGRIRTIGPDGALVLDVDGAPVAVSAGDLTLEEA